MKEGSLTRDRANAKITREADDGPCQLLDFTYFSVDKIYAQTLTLCSLLRYKIIYGKVGVPMRF